MGKHYIGPVGQPTGSIDPVGCHYIGTVGAVLTLTDPRGRVETLTNPRGGHFKKKLADRETVGQPTVSM